MVPDPMLDPPVMTIRIRQAAARRPSAGPTDAGPAARPDLRLGRHDVLKKTIFARLEGDSVILALPDNLLDVLPKNPLAFRDRSIVTDSPAEIKQAHDPPGRSGRRARAGQHGRAQRLADAPAGGGARPTPGRSRRC